MKRSLSIMFTVAVLLVFACKQKPVVTPGTSPTISPAEQIAAAPNQKNVTITIEKVNGVCTIFDPGDIYLSVNKHKIKWCVDYKCPDVEGVIVVIDDFKDQNQKDLQPTRRNPFGDHSDRDNTFDFGPLGPNGSDCTKVSGLATIKGHYFYRIMVIGPGGALVASKDPGVIIGDD
jgi:hypothetical protein